MPGDQDNKTLSDRGRLAYGTLVFSGLAITILATVAIWHAPEEQSMTIFNMALPVIASWVGTILAFYFGRENFESANQQVRQLVEKLTPEQRAQTKVTAIMRGLGDLEKYQFSQGESEKTVPLTALVGKMVGSISRLPIIDIDAKPKYIIHDSMIDKYRAAGGNKTDNLEKFIGELKKEGYEFGPNKGYGFVVVSKNTTLGAAKNKMESIKTCKDIFITENGSEDEPLLGWISNIRLAKYMEM